MHELVFDNTPDPKTLNDGHSNLVRAIDEVQFLVTVFGQLPPPEFDMEDIAGGMYAILNDILEKLHGLADRFPVGKEVSA